MTPDTPTLGDVLGAAGGPFPVEHGGRTWLVGAPTLQARDVFHKLLVAAALKAAQEADIDIPGLGTVKQFRDDHHQRKYRPGGEKWREWTEGEDGNALFLASLLYQHHPADASVELAKRLIEEAPDAVAVALGEVLPGFFDLLAADERMPRPVRDLYSRAATILRRKATPSPTPPGGSTTSNST
jgi:hypothetical protein